PSTLIDWPGPTSSTEPGFPGSLRLAGERPLLVTQKSLPGALHSAERSPAARPSARSAETVSLSSSRSAFAGRDGCAYSHAQAAEVSPVRMTTSITTVP